MNKVIFERDALNFVFLGMIFVPSITDFSRLYIHNALIHSLFTRCTSSLNFQPSQLNK